MGGGWSGFLGWQLTIIDIGSAKSYIVACLSVQIGANVSQCVIIQEKETIDVSFGKW